MNYSIESSACVGNNFTTSCNDWRDGTYENFTEWASKQFGLKEFDPDDNAEVPVHFQKAKDIEFKRNKAGEFILPPMSNYRTIRQKQRVVRGYIGAVYRQYIYFILFLFLLIKLIGEFTGNRRAAFPYISASKDDQTIFSPDCVPDGFVLSDPDHLPGFKIETLYCHWLKRQRTKISPFIILKADPQHELSGGKSAKAKGKRKIEYKEVDSNDEEVQSEEGEEETKKAGEGGGDGEEDDGTTDEEEEDISPVVKYGPPNGKARKNQTSNQLNDDLNAAAGPSKHPQPKQLPKKNAKPRTTEDPIEPAGREKKSSTLKKLKTSNTGAVRAVFFGKLKS